MKLPVRWACFAVVAGAGLLASGRDAQAGDVDFSGTFGDDNDVAAFDFTVGANSFVRLFSSSWLYGEPPAGAPPGGFDPVLAIWNMDAGGTLVYQQNDVGYLDRTGISNGVTYDIGLYDVDRDQFLVAGHYRATIAQWDNYAAGSTLAQGFRYDANPDFTFDNGYGGATQPYFNGRWTIGGRDDPRTGDWAFHIVNVESASLVVPLPRSAALGGAMLVGLLGAAALRRRRRA